MAELAEAGVKRISVGGSLARAALGAVKRAGEEILGRGTFGYAAEAMPGGRGERAHVAGASVEPNLRRRPGKRRSAAGRSCGHKVRAGARIVALFVFRLWAENACSPG